MATRRMVLTNQKRLSTLNMPQNQRLIPNLHMSLGLHHRDPSHLTWQVHGHQTNITTQIIKLSHQQRPGLRWLSP